MVIPSFAVGRTHELLYFIREINEQILLPEYSDFEVYLDSPLAIEATKVFTKNMKGCFDEAALKLVNSGINPLVFPGLKISTGSEDSKQINFIERPKVIISASGMCEAGRIRHHPVRGLSGGRHAGPADFGRGEGSKALWRDH